MSLSEKRLEDMRSNPRKGWTIDDVRVVCSGHGRTESAERRLARQGRAHEPERNSDTPAWPANQTGLHLETGRSHRRGEEARAMKTTLEYPVQLQPLSQDDGGGWLAVVPDLPGCMTDGESPTEALDRVQDAIDAWRNAALEMARKVPAPTVKALADVK